MSTGNYDLQINWPNGRHSSAGTITDEQWGEVARVLSPGWEGNADHIEQGLGMADKNSAAQSAPDGLYAIHYRDNWDGQGDTYYMIAEQVDQDRWFDKESGQELLQYQGDAILKKWPLTVARQEQGDEVRRLREALEFYANGDHLLLADPDVWDTCSGEPMNWLHDEAGTASVEDGSLAKAALSAQQPAGIDSEGGSHD